ncbi:hypothetical protein PFISCL1PPCAC_2272 [Pristionchus fissidentatus]|uniref:Secreted protein n=1 Tax=Pristionchus fissidentatus TaxID=1538716 RepID=A0AAV5UXR2_9BILA|nr:hypothetical protein PFISCL1PPCAC_2272 [Pristionchus fissidentatus]
MRRLLVLLLHRCFKVSAINEEGRRWLSRHRLVSSLLRRPLSPCIRVSSTFCRLIGSRRQLFRAFLYDRVMI